MWGEKTLTFQSKEELLVDFSKACDLFFALSSGVLVLLFFSQRMFLSTKSATASALPNMGSVDQCDSLSDSSWTDKAN